MSAKIPIAIMLVTTFASCWFLATYHGRPTEPRVAEQQAGVVLGAGAR